MKEVLPPLTISRWVLLAFVAAGALVSIATSGHVSHFAGGFAAGAGAAFIVSRLRRPAADESSPGGSA